MVVISGNGACMKLCHLFVISHGIPEVDSISRTVGKGNFQPQEDSTDPYSSSN